MSLTLNLWLIRLRTELHPQNLSALQSLTFLTLSQDLTSPLWAKPTKQFQWMLSTLVTCRQPNVIEGIRIILQTPYLSRCKESDWSGLDALLTAPCGWPRLTSLEVVSLTVESEIERSGVDYFDRISPPLLPLLVHSGVEVSLTTAYINFRQDLQITDRYIKSLYVM